MRLLALGTLTLLAILALPAATADTCAPLSEAARACVGDRNRDGAPDGASVSSSEASAGVGLSTLPQQGPLAIPLNGHEATGAVAAVRVGEARLDALVIHQNSGDEDANGLPESRTVSVVAGGDEEASFVLWVEANDFVPTRASLDAGVPGAEPIHLALP